MPHYRHLLFDLDNTLWNFTNNARSALHDVYSTYQVEKYYPNFDAYYNCFEEHNVALWRLYGTDKITKDFLHTERFLAPLRKFGIINESLAKEMGTYYLEQCCVKTEVMPNTFSTLDYLQDRYRLHIVSNGFKEVQYKKMQHSGLYKYFDTIFLSDIIGVHKPNPDFFAHVFTKIPAQKNECLVIGDNFEADIEGAMNFGIDQVFYSPETVEINSPTPTYVIRDLAELCHFL